MNAAHTTLAERAAPVQLQPVMPGSGLPQERLARIASRRAFVEMKQCYMNAASDIAGATAAMLQLKVRRASEPWELWSLRAVILASLPSDHQRTTSHRLKLEREFDSIFSSSGQ
jgi:hypothetical protein